MSELPPGWAIASVDDLRSASPNSITDGPFGSNLKTAHYTSSGPIVIRLGNIGSCEFIDIDRAHISAEHFDTLKKHHVFGGDILIAALGDPIGRACLLPDEVQPALVKADCFRFRPAAELHSSYLVLWLNSEDAKAKFLAASHGLGRVRINLSDFRKAQVPVAPFSEQKRIVTKFNRLTSTSRRARENLGHIPRLVEKYKQAILAAAFRGELTREWRAKNALNRIVDHHSSQIDARLIERPDLPSNWRWQAVFEVMVISGGLTKNPKRNAMAMRHPYLRVANVYANELRLAEISEIGCTEKEFEKTKLIPGDLLIVEGNGSLEQIGRVAIWNDEIKECSHQNHIIRARPFEIVEPRYALFWLLSPAGRKAIEAVASSSSGLHTLSITKVGGLPIPLCAKSEQVEIVRLIESAFAWIDRLSGETTSARKLINHLDQAILAKAFRGELVPQDPNDEPASVLLERIRADRESRAETKSKRVGKR